MIEWRWIIPLVDAAIGITNAKEKKGCQAHGGEYDKRSPRNEHASICVILEHRIRRDGGADVT
jgi:hypothetical protein